MKAEAERRREEEMIAACANHTWNESDRSDFEKRGIESEEQLKERIREVVNDPRTRVFSCNPKMDLNHPNHGEQFQREVYLLRENSRTTVVVLNGNGRDGTAWVGSGNQEKRLLQREMDKNELTREPEVLTGGRPALLERQQHRQMVEYKPEPQRSETLMEKLDREAREQGRKPLDVLFEKTHENTRQMDRRPTIKPEDRR